MIPNAFYGYLQVKGFRPTDGTIGQRMLSETHDTFIILRQSQEAVTRLVNKTPLVQYYEGDIKYLAAKSETDFHTAMTALDRLATSKRLESLGADGVNTLTQMKNAMQGVS
jgi:hypothetical protein